MATLEDLHPNLQIKGILPNQSVTIISIQWHGTTAVEIVYKRPDGQPGSQFTHSS